MADIKIDEITNKYSELNHNWSGNNSFKSGTSTVRLMPVDDKTDNSASTEWVNLFFNNKIPTTPTINVPLLTPMWFDHVVSSSAWVRSDIVRNKNNSYGWLSSTVYGDIYAHLVLDVKNKTPTTDDNDVSCINADDGHRIILSSIDENGVEDTQFNTYGVSWYYVLDTNNKRFKLPRTRYGFQGIKNNGSVGKYDKPGIPNHTHNFNYQHYATSINIGDWSTAHSVIDNYPITTSSGTTEAVTGSSIYGSSTTVQPPATEMYLYFATGDENAYGSGGVGGGVIDGSKWKPKVEVSPKTSDSTNSYVVDNDCYLAILILDSGAGKTVTITVNEVESDECVVHKGQLINMSGTTYFSEAIPVKRGSKVNVKMGSNFASGAKITYIEYKLNSLAPQIAMPDWDSTKKKSIESGHLAPENGYICCIPTQITSTESGAFWFNVNGITVFDGGCEGSNYHDNQRTVVPVSKGDIITFAATNGVYTLEAAFYPCKSVQQSDSSSSNGVFMSKKITDGTILYASSFEVKSDGWIKDGGMNLISKKEYTVQNDCKLRVRANNIPTASNGLDVYAIYLNEITEDANIYLACGWDFSDKCQGGIHSKERMFDYFKKGSKIIICSSYNLPTEHTAHPTENYRITVTEFQVDS